MDFKELLKKWNKNIYKGAALKFAQAMGVSPMSVSRWASGSRPDETLLSKIAKELGVTVPQLMDCFPAKGRNEGAQVIGAVSRSLAADVIPMASNTPQNVPFFGPVCAGGANFSFDAMPESYLPLYMPAPKGRRLGSWLVQGDCMDDGTPDAIRAGDTIIVVEQDYADSGKIVVAMLDGEITLKKLLHQDGHVELQPKNPKHKPIMVKTENFKILGVVIGSFRRL